MELEFRMNEGGDLTVKLLGNEVGESLLSEYALAGLVAVLAVLYIFLRIMMRPKDDHDHEEWAGRMYEEARE